MNCGSLEAGVGAGEVIHIRLWTVNPRRSRIPVLIDCPCLVKHWFPPVQEFKPVSVLTFPPLAVPLPLSLSVCLSVSQSVCLSLIYFLIY